MKKICIVIFALVGLKLNAQVVNTGVMDTADFRYQGKVTLEGYIDSYYCYDFNRPSGNNRPYAVSMSRHNEVTINLAFVDLKYSSSRLRARFVPGFGTYINANYTDEPGVLKNIVEASAGIKIFKTKSVWFDFGVFGSPYTNESAISKDHLAYTRSFAPEFVPYYLSGAKLSAVLSPKVNAYLYLVNGWQQIEDKNAGKSLGTQVEYRPNNHWLLNWNTYVGNEKTTQNPDFGNRYFTDVFFIYANGRWSATGCGYVGFQEREQFGSAQWWQANIIGRYDLTTKISVTGRVEYFHDPETVVVQPVTGLSTFSCYSGSAGLNVKPAENILLRAEYRAYYSLQDTFYKDGEPSKNESMITTSVAIWF